MDPVACDAPSTNDCRALHRDKDSPLLCKHLKAGRHELCLDSGQRIAPVVLSLGGSQSQRYQTTEGLCIVRLEGADAKAGQDLSSPAIGQESVAGEPQDS